MEPQKKRRNRILIVMAVVILAALICIAPARAALSRLLLPPSLLASPTARILTETSLPSGEVSVAQQLAKIDEALRQSLLASIAYNAPSAMKLDESVTIELLLNPTISPEELATQVTESGHVIQGTVEITPRMKAVLKTQEQDAFDIQPLHDNPEQIISGTDTTKWLWFVTAKKAGLHRLTLIVYRLVKFEGQDYWREVESYKADIDVKVTFVQRMQEFDWQWIAGIVITLIGIPALWRYIDNRNKNMKKRAKK